MKIIKRLIKFIVIISMIIVMLVGCNKVNKYRSNEEIDSLKTVKISVFPYREEDYYVSAIDKHLMDIQDENQNKVQFTFYDSKGDQALQNENINKVIEEGTDMLLINIVDIEQSQWIINKAKENNLPIIFYNREPSTLNPIKSYSKALYVGTDATQSGILQGRVLIDEWNSKKEIIDRNGDGILQYIMLKGERDNKEAIKRTKYSIDTIENAGIKTEELALRVADWNKELAKSATESLFFRYGNRIEAIIANNDAMAIGAIEALQAMGFNKRNESRTIPVVGIDASPEAQELIAKGVMTGTVFQDFVAKAEALYRI